MDHRDQIDARFRSDLSRARSLVVLYQGFEVGLFDEKKSTIRDLLRAAVLITHAGLEDLIRSIAAWKLPQAPAESLERIFLPGRGREREKFSLVELAEYRGRTVDEVIQMAVNRYLDHSNFNQVNDIIEMLDRLELKVDIPSEIKSQLAAMMSRRHWIAHRADRELTEAPDPNRQEVGRAIEPRDVNDWIDATTNLGQLVLAKI